MKALGIDLGDARIGLAMGDTVIYSDTPLAEYFDGKFFLDNARDAMLAVPAYQ